MENAIVQLHITYEFGLVHRHFLDLQQQKLIFEFKIFFLLKKYFQQHYSLVPYKASKDIEQKKGKHF